jgi:hypothetical protein
MNEERTRLVLKQQKRCGELQLVFHDQCGPYSGVVDETVPQGMPEKGKKGLNLAVYLAMKLKVAKKLTKEIHREYSLLALLL